jgi:hypothetical protein
MDFRTTWGRAEDVQRVQTYTAKQVCTDQVNVCL